VSAAAAGTATGYKGTFNGRAEEAGRVRREVAGYLGDCPVTDDIVLIADELAANAILHTRSRGGFFRVRCELSRVRADRGRGHGRAVAYAQGR
jgi:hypothetical protein